MKCNTPDYIDPSLKKWEVVSSSKNPFKQPLPTQSVEAFPYVIVYCFTRKITFEDKTIDCPWYPFKVRADVAWKTDDDRYNPFTDGLAVNLTINATQFNAPWSKTEHLPAKESIEAIKKLFELTEEHDRMEQDLVLFELLKHQVTYSQATGGLLSLVLILSFGVAGCVAWVEHRHRQRKAKQWDHHKKMSRRLRRLHQAIMPNLEHTDSENEEQRPTITKPPSRYPDLTAYIRQLTTYRKVVKTDEPETTSLTEFANAPQRRGGAGGM